MLSSGEWHSVPTARLVLTREVAWARSESWVQVCPAFPSCAASVSYRPTCAGGAWHAENARRKFPLNNQLQPDVRFLSHGVFFRFLFFGF